MFFYFVRDIFKVTVSLSSCQIASNMLLLRVVLQIENYIQNDILTTFLLAFET